MKTMDYQFHLRAYERASLLSLLCGIVVVSTVFFPHMFVTLRVDRIGVDAVSIAVILGWALTSGMIISWIALRLQRRSRELGLYCLLCQASLVGFPQRRLRVTGRCSHCGAQVLEPNACPFSAANAG